MLIAQGRGQLVSETAPANSSGGTPAVTVETKTTSAPNELTALTSTTVLVASHADNCDSYNELDGSEQETNL